MKTYHDVSQIQAWMEAARKPIQMPIEGLRGWSVCPVDPAAMVAAFEPLRLKKEYILHTYLFRDGTSTEGAVYALPENARLVEPQECTSHLTHDGFKFPIPHGALPSPMQAIEGDGSPEMYLAASILARELHDFMRTGHGVWWAQYELLSVDPFIRTPRSAPPLFIDWRRSFIEAIVWHEDREWPNDWHPSVEITNNEATVRFITFLFYYDWIIEEHVDRYRIGSCECTSEARVIMEGPESDLCLKKMFGETIKPIPELTKFMNSNAVESA